MIAAQQHPSLSTANRRESRSRQRLQARAHEILAQEIAFIPNAQFRELDDDPCWQANLAHDDTDVAPPAASVSQARMPAHLERLCSAPLLTPRQERDLFCTMNYLKYRANCLRAKLAPERATQRQLDEITQMLARATQVRNQIIHSNIRLVMSIVKQFADDRNRFDDLLSEGISCLIKAVDKFDFDRGFRFSTYATRAVRREVFRLVQRHHRERTRYASGSQEVLSQQSDRPTEPDGVEMTWQRVDESIGRLLSGLDEREKFIVQARYGFDDLGEKPTFQRLGQMLGVSKERVRQIEQRALGKLREMATSLQLEVSQ